MEGPARRLLQGSAGATTTISVVFGLVYVGMVLGGLPFLQLVGVAGRRGTVIDWRGHARVGVPVTVATMAIAVVWLVWRAG